MSRRALKHRRAWAALLLLLLTPQAARADNCSGLNDCYGTIAAAAAVAVGIAALIVFIAFLPEILAALGLGALEAAEAAGAAEAGVAAAAEAAEVAEAAAAAAEAAEAAATAAEAGEAAEAAAEAGEIAELAEAAEAGEAAELGEAAEAGQAGAETAEVSEAAEGAEAAESAEGPGSWQPASESMSERAAQYQSQISGRPPGQVYDVNGVKFDGHSGNTLLDAKGPGYGKFVSPEGTFKPWYRGADSLLDQAERQLAAAEGNPIRWEVAEQRAADAIRALLRENGYGSIEVVHTPPLP